MKSPVLRVIQFRSPRRPFHCQKRQPFFFRIVAQNGRTIAQSEGYATAAGRDKTMGLLTRARMEVVK